MKIKIFVAYHKISFFVKNEIFEPIHVGKELSNINLSMISDNEGENISIKNDNYSELTALYWAWKNMEDVDYIGLCHYRRFFSFRHSIYYYLKERVNFYSSLFVVKNYDCSIRNTYIINNKACLIKEIEKFTNKLKKDIKNNNRDIYALNGAIFAKKSIKTLFSKPSGEFVIDLLVKIVNEKYPKYSESLIRTLKNNKIHYANMTIMRKAYFNEYCTFLFDVLETHESQAIKSGWCKDSLNERCYFRLSGYLGELLTSAFVSYNIINRNNVKLLNTISFIEQES